MTAYIGYNNLLESATVTVTSAASGYPKENAYDWLTSDWWKAAAAGTVYLTADFGEAKTFDSWGLAAHNLPDNSGTIKPQYSSNGSDWSDFDTVQTPADGSPIFRKVTSRTVRYARWEISSTGAASLIGSLFIGPALALPEPMGDGWYPPRLAADDVLYNNETDGGAFVGRSVVRAGLSFTIDQDLITRAWIDANWESLAAHIRTKSFYFSWDAETYPGEAVFCWLNAKKVPRPQHSSPMYLKFSIPVKGI
jgi:hypothetical protein